MAKLEFSLEVQASQGLDAKESAKLCMIASKHSCRVQASKVGAGRWVNAKSVMGVLLLSAPKGAAIAFEIEAEDEEAGHFLKSELTAFFEASFKLAQR